jgi:glycine dehydrogenase subunit 1
MVTAATIYMSLLGGVGLAAVARQSASNTAKLVAGLTSIDGIERLFSGPAFHEVALKFDRPVGPVLEALAARGILGGYDLGADFPDFGDALLVCATETKTEADIDAYVGAMREIFSGSAA